jgi:hypothetical protein
MMHASRDSALAMAQKIRIARLHHQFYRCCNVGKEPDEQLSSKPEDQNENWALIWGEERILIKKERKTLPQFMETWRINKGWQGGHGIPIQKKARFPEKIIVKA